MNTIHSVVAVALARLYFRSLEEPEYNDMVEIMTQTKLEDHWLCVCAFLQLRSKLKEQDLILCERYATHQDMPKLMKICQTARQTWLVPA